MLLLMEGFDAYHTAAGNSLHAYLLKKWLVGNWPAYYLSRAGRWAGMALELWDNDIYLKSKTLPSTDTTLYVGFNLYPYALGDSAWWLLGFYGPSGYGPYVQITAGGELRVKDQYGTLIGTTSGAGLQVGVWSHIEVKMICGAAGSAIIKVNGVTRLTTGTFDSRKNVDAYYAQVEWRGNPRIWIDDIFVCDSTGSQNNNFLGLKQVIALMPNAAGDSAQWTPSAGDNYACVDERPPSDTDYVQSETVDHLDLYNMEAVSSLTGGICGVQINALAKSTVDGMPWNVKLPFKGSAQSDGDAELVWTSAGEYVSRILETNPDTGNPWEISELNSAQFGLKLVS